MAGTILITGGNRGIGLELVRQYDIAGWRVIATARDPTHATELAAIATASQGRVSIERLDLADFATIDSLAATHAGEPIDVIVNNAGHFGPRNDDSTDLPKRLHGQLFGNVDYDAALETIRINAYAPLRIAETFRENLRLGTQKKFVAISSSAGSIAGGLKWDSPIQLFIYPVSKATLNKVTATLSMILKQDGIVTVALCPGHVRTRLGGPGASISAEESAMGLREVIGDLTAADNGRFIRYDGSPIAW